MTLATLVTGREGDLAGAFDFRGTIKRSIVERFERWIGLKWGGRTVAVRSFHDEIASATDLEDAQRVLLGQAPAILVAGGRATYRNRSTNGDVIQCDRFEVEVFYASTNLSHPASGLEGGSAANADAGGDPGVDRMLADGIKLLHRFSPAGKWRELVLDDETLAAAGLGAIVFQQTWLTSGPIELGDPVDIDPPKVAKLQADFNLIEQEGTE